MNEKQKIRIRPVEEKDIDRLPDFLSEGFPGDPPDLWKPRFEMWWDKNPFMNLVIPKGWVLEKDRSLIVGFMGNIPLKYQINGKVGNAAASSSWYVRPEFQGIWSVQLMNAFLKQENIQMFLSTTPVGNVERILQRFGFTPLELPFNRAEYWHIIDYDKVFLLMTDKLSKTHKILSPFLKFMSFKLKVLSRLKRNYKRGLKYKQNHGDYECFLCTNCDDSFSNLWDKTRKSNTTTLNRDAQALNWLYFSDAVKEKRFVIKCIRKPGNDLAGYIAYDLNYYSDIDIKILKLKDAYLPEINEPIIFSLLAFSFGLAKELDVSGLRLWAIDQKMERLLKKKVKFRRKFFLPYYYKLEKSLGLKVERRESHEFIPSPIDPNRGTL
jgi:hypothetical protein